MNYRIALTLVLGVFSCLAETNQVYKEQPSEAKAALDVDTCPSSVLCATGDFEYSLQAFASSSSKTCKKNRGIITVISTCTTFGICFFVLNVTLKNSQGVLIGQASGQGVSPSVQFSDLPDGTYEIEAKVQPNSCTFAPICVTVENKPRMCIPFLYCCK